MGRSNITDSPTCFPYWHFWCKGNLKSVSIKNGNNDKVVSLVGKKKLYQPLVFEEKNFTKWCKLYYCKMIYYWWILHNIIPLRFPASNHELTTNSWGCCFFCFSFTSVKLLNGLCCFLQLFKKFVFLSKQTGNETQFR